MSQLICTPNHRQNPTYPVPKEGTFRGRHGRWNGMRWTLMARKTNAPSVDGEVVWS
jgi:hypothetical protein